MLNYLGPNVGGQGPVADTLPKGVPGTMPGGIPGAGGPSPQVPPPPHPHADHGGGAPHHGGGAHHPAALHGSAPPNPAILAAILHGATGGAMGQDIKPPALPQYVTTTQTDGSILLHVKNADGTPGPVVKLIPPVKRGGGEAGGAPQTM